MGVKSRYRQLCWKCKYSCDENNCIWVRTLKEHFKGTILDKNGYITYCPNFEKDAFIYDTNYILELFNIKINTYYYYSQLRKRKGIKTPLVKFIRDMLDKGNDTDSISQKQKERIRLNNVRAYIKRKGLNITPEEYIRQREEKKKLRKDPNYINNYQKARYYKKIKSEFENGNKKG